jgi:hypothetical protein
MVSAISGIASCCQETSVVPFHPVTSAARSCSWPLANFAMMLNFSFAARGETVSVGRLLLLPTFTVGATFALPGAEA